MNCILASLCAFSFVLLTTASAFAAARPPKYDGASDADAREYQTVGKAVVSPDGKFFLYEWMKPYNWKRDTKGLPRAAANRLQTLIYKVDTDYTPPESQYLFHPESAASFWLGTLSPDGGKVSFYELDNDSDKVKLGICDVAGGTLMEPKLTWFEEAPAPDAARLDQVPVWVSNDQLIYPGAGKGKLMRADVKTGRAEECSDCATAYEQGKAAQNSQPKSPAAPTVGPDTRLLAASPKGDLAVYAKENADVLSVLYKKGSAEPETLFENRRRGPYALAAESKDAAAKKTEQ